MGGLFAGGISLADARIDDITAFFDGLTTCGNSVADHGEPCDDGNPIDGDGCDSQCRRPPG